jgi:hypothetical protein
MSVVRRMLRTNLVRHGSNRTKAVSFTPFGRHFMTTVTLENQTQVRSLLPLDHDPVGVSNIDFEYSPIG